MDYITALIVGVAASFVAALVFLAFMNCIRPRFEIGAHMVRNYNARGRKRFEVKVRNKSMRAAIDICPKLQVVHVTHPSGGHSLMTVEEIELITKHMFILSGYRPRDQDARYAARFSTEIDLDERWTDREHSYLRFVIKATDRVSGISDVFERQFRGDDAVKDGTFKTGRSMEIVPDTRGAALKIQPPQGVVSAIPDPGTTRSRSKSLKSAPDV